MNKSCACQGKEKRTTIEFPYLVYIQFDESKKTYVFGCEEPLSTGEKVILDTARGQEIGNVAFASIPFDKSRVQGELKRVIRKATPEDLKRKEENLEKAKEAMEICQCTIDQLHLDMRLISCEYTLDRHKVIFTYISDERVDFRQLLKLLASSLACRIELRQVGPRNKAKLVGGIGNCGRECCCSKFMTEFDTVSINMAKNQMLALNISKLSGQCGKLMCCLRYENDEYTKQKEGLPKLNSLVVYEGKTYRLTTMNLLQHQAKLENKEEILFVPFEEIWPERKEEFGEDE